MNCHNLLKNQIALTFYNISYGQIKYSDLHWVAVCTITSRSHGNGKTDIGLSNLDMPTKRVSFSHSPTTAIMKNVYLLMEVNNNAETGKRKYVCRRPLVFSNSKSSKIKIFTDPNISHEISGIRIIYWLNAKISFVSLN